MDTYQYVIIGGGIAGGRTAEGIRKVDKDGSIAIVSNEDHRPYERPPLSKRFLRGEADEHKVYLQDDDFYAENNIDMFRGTQAVQIDPAEKQVVFDNDDRMKYDKLMLATGGRARSLPLPGSDLENVFTLRTVEDSIAIRTASGEGKHALVMGGSFIGAEVAASLRQLGTQVTEIFPESRLLERIVPEETSQYIHRLYDGHNIRVLPGTVAERLEGSGTVAQAVLDNGETLEVDLVVMGVGIELNTDIAQEAGLKMQQEDQAIIVDEHLRTSDPNIYAAGDIAAWPGAVFDKRLRVEHWDVARRQGLRAGRNMAGENEPYTALPYFFSDIFDLSFEVWGDLSNWDETIRRGSLADGSFAYFYFRDGKLTGVFTVNRPAHERLPMQSLIKERVSIDKLAGKVSDTNIALDELTSGKSETAAAPASSKQLSFTEDIRPLFREKDVEEMKDIAGFDLSDYDDARKWADGIYATLVDGSMPCDGPWPDEDVQKFKQWMDSGFAP